MTDDMVVKMVQYTHLEKLYGYLPGMADAIPAIHGLSPVEYAELTAGFDAQAAQAAEELLADPSFAARVAELPFRPGQTVLAVGDSITDDLQSWAEILRHLVRSRPDADARVVNAGLSAHTTAMVRRRWLATLAGRPDWILCCLGGNDVTRVGPEPTRPQVSLAETVANLTDLRRIAAARTSVNWVWLTPVPVDEERAASYRPFQYGESTWRNSDITAVADAVRAFPDPVVDLTETFGTPPTPELQGPDGVHPSLAGQQAIAAAVVRRLTVSPP